MLDEEELIIQSKIRFPDVDEQWIKLAVQAFLMGVYKDKDGNTIDENELPPANRIVLKNVD